MKALQSIGETRTILPNVSWSTYEALLEDTGPRRGRIAYEEGLLEIMSPSFEHEKVKSILGLLVHVYAEELGIDLSSLGSLTLKRELRRRGVEPDECFYIQNDALVRHKKEIDLAVDPPPDLAIEIEITKSALDKLGIYSALRVPEPWFHDTERLRIHVLEAEGRYVEAPASRVLPGLPVPELERCLSRRGELSATALAGEFRSILRSLPR